MAEERAVKRIDIKEFQERGYLQEANRLFFHHLGLALEVIVDDKDGSVKLGGVWDSREDPEGIVFDEFDQDKADFVWKERMSRLEARIRLGCCSAMGIQHSNYPLEKE